MTEKTVKGTITTAYEKPVSPALSYSVQVKQYETADEIRTAGEWPNDKAIVNMVNAKEVAAARASAIKTQLEAAGIKAPTLEDADEAVKATAKVLLARKLAATEEEAIEKAKEILGL